MWGGGGAVAAVAHREQAEYLDFVKSIFPDFFRGKRELEVGSLDVNGSPRPLFQGCEYIALDLAPGPGVDVTGVAHTYDAPDKSFDVVLSTECLEHNPFWAETLQMMVRVLKPGGLCVVTCATTGRPVHGTSSTDEEGRAKHAGWVTLPNASCELPGWDRDYYRNLTRHDFYDAVPLMDVFEQFKFTVEPNHCDLYFWGVKG